MLYLLQILQLTCVETPTEPVFLKGSTVCAASYVNDPRNTSRRANLFWHEYQLSDLGEDTEDAVQASVWSMELRRMFQVALYASEDMKASAAQPRELFIEYGDRFWSGDADNKRVRKFVDDEVLYVSLLLCPFLFVFSIVIS